MKTFETIFQEFLERCDGEYSYRNYNRRLSLFVDLYGTTPITQITPKMVNEWSQQIKKKGYSPITNFGYWQAAKAVFNYAVNTGEINRSPAAHLKIGSYVPEQVNLPNEDDVQKVTDLAQKFTFCRNLVMCRRAALWLLSLESGARLGELQAMRYKALKKALDDGPDKAGVYWIESSGKTGKALISFTEPTALALRNYFELRPNSSAHLAFLSVREPFEGLTKRGVQNDFQDLCKAAGVKNIYPHHLRHRLGTLLGSIDPKVAQLKLGHSKIETTLKHYYHPNRERVGELTARLAPTQLVFAKPLPDVPAD